MVPVIYKENKSKVVADIKEGRLDYAELSQWSFQDKFFAFLLATRFFEVCGASYPTPRKKEEVPIWFLLMCMVQMKLHTTAAFHKLPGILRNGPIMSRVKFNIGGVKGGFNNKNQKDRDIPIDFDTARKFFKDTDSFRLESWHNHDVQKFIKHNRGFDKHGIFILDQTHVVVPDNPNYKDAVWMAVDEHGQRIDTSNMTEEQKKVIRYRLCYSLSELMHVGKEDKNFIFAGYKLSPGNQDDLADGKILIKEFVAAVGKDVMKLLITDRGYIDGEFITTIKEDLGSDVLMPLRQNMTALTDSIQIAESLEYKWTEYSRYTKDGVTYLEEVAVIEEMRMWDKCRVPLYVSIMRTTGSNGKKQYWGLAATFKPQYAKEAFELYALRTQIEERHRQVKTFWNIREFTSPNASLIEAHVLFTLLTYSMIQLYLTKNHLQELTNKTIQTLHHEESLGTNAVITYSNEYFAVIDLSDYSEILVNLEGDARERFKKWHSVFKQSKTVD